MCQHFGALERKLNRQLTKPIFPAVARNAVWGWVRLPFQIPGFYNLLWYDTTNYHNGAYSTTVQQIYISNKCTIL